MNIKDAESERWLKVDGIQMQATHFLSSSSASVAPSVYSRRHEMLMAVFSLTQKYS